MPYIEVRTNLAVTESQEVELKSAFGKAITKLHKSENYLMVGINSPVTLFFGGKRLERGAFVSIDTFGESSSSDCSAMTKEVCAILEKVLSIPGDAVYIKYGSTQDWGWNGGNF